jgi:hypothetical protein
MAMQVPPANTTRAQPETLAVLWGLTSVRDF